MNELGDFGTGLVLDGADAKAGRKCTPGVPFNSVEWGLLDIIVKR